MPNDPLMNPITEDDIADYLANTPDFFERHAQLLAQVQLTSPHGNRAVSLQERQAEMLRDKIKALEHRLMDMLRHGTDNVVTADRLQRWTASLLASRDARALPTLIVTALCDQFMVPQAAMRIWDCDSDYGDESFAQGVSDDVKTLANSLEIPFCGLNAGFEAVQWLEQPANAVSIAMIPMRPARETAAFGMIVLASPDAQRFGSGLGTDFLERIGAISAAAISRLRP